MAKQKGTYLKLNGKVYNLDDFAQTFDNLNAAQIVYQNLLARHLWVAKKTYDELDVNKSLTEGFKGLKKNVKEIMKGLDKQYDYIAIKESHRQ